MTRMSADDPNDGPDNELYDETPPRSIFAATWFRALLVLIVLGVVGAVSVPYILDAMNPPIKAGLASRGSAPRAMTPAAPSAPTTADKPADKSVVPERAATETAAPVSLTPRKPLAGDTTALADKTTPPDRSTVSDKPTPSDRSTVSDKPTSSSSEKSAPSGDRVVASDKLAGAPKLVATDTPTVASARPARRPAAASATTQRAVAAGDWWVQVGAFRDQGVAQKIATRLREQNYPVTESSGNKSAAAAPVSTPPSTPARADEYDVVVSDVAVADLNTRLAAKGLTAEASGTGAIVKPSLPLRDAVALSKDLAVDGLKVQVRRAATASESAPATASTPSTGDTLIRVRVGGFSDRATAVSTLKELEAKGYKPFIARGMP